MIMERKAVDQKALLNTIFGDWAMFKLDGARAIKRVGPDEYPRGAGEGEGEQLAAVNFWAVENSIKVLHCPRYASVGIRSHLEAVHMRHLAAYGCGLMGVHREYWRAFVPLVLEHASNGYKGVE